MMQDQDYYRDLEQLERRVFERCLAAGFR